MVGLGGGGKAGTVLVYRERGRGDNSAGADEKEDE